MSVRVLYLAGFGRSGSTLLARMLGQLDGVVSVGELHHIWRTGALSRSSDELCGCGLSFQRCEFWDAVLDEVFADRPAAGDILSLRSRVDRIRRIPLMLARTAPRRFTEDLETYRDIVRRLYRAVLRIGAGQLVVDAGKDISPLYVLATLPEIDVRVVHLVRDPRGVSYSWSKRVRGPQFPHRDVYMNTYGATNAALRWTYTNVLAELARQKHRRHLRVRYEDLASDPKQWLQRIITHAGLGSPALPFAGSSSIDLVRPNHIVSGNPMRFVQGRVELRLDDEWQHEMSLARRVGVSTMTWPLRRRYGYRGGW